MGALNHFNLNSYIEKYNTTTFVETGLGRGDGLKYAQNSSFKKLYSIEILQSIIDLSKDDFANDERIEIICANSVDGLKDIFKKTPKDENILFWADSHFPGYDLGLSAIDAEKDESIRLPLWNELLLIKESRPQSKDVILMDDLMIFSEIEVFPHNHLKDVHRIKNEVYKNYLDKIKNLFSETHEYQLFYEDSGYLAIFPK